jgi:hypothetical protein
MKYFNKNFTKKNLIAMIDSHNKLTGGNIKTKQNKSGLINDLQNAMNESIVVPKCVMKKMSSINTDEIFKVNGPLKTGSWLSTININDIMSQYQELYPDFAYIGTVPIDFKEIYPEIFNIKKDKTITNYGIIFNTDPSNKPGQHWIALYINTLDKTICFFDSVGNSPPKQVVDFIKQVKKQLGDFTVYVNKKIHQKRDGTCGLYAINFVISQLKGQTCNKYFYCVKEDAYIEKSRKLLFK